MSYYDTWEPGVFPHQEALCRALADTPYALEDPPFNPLTIRLVAAYRAIARFAGLLECRQPPAAALVDESDVPTLAWIIDRPVLLPTTEAADAQAFPLVEAQAALSDFAGAFTAALDRIAWEIDLLTGLGLATATWRALRRPRALTRLRRRMPAMAAWVEGATATPLGRAFDLRDWFDVAGFIPMTAEATEGGRRWRAWVPGAGTTGSGGAVDTDALQFQRVLLREGCAVFNGVYHMLSQRVLHEGPPPWA